MRISQLLCASVLSISAVAVQAAEPYSFVGARYSTSMSGEATAEFVESEIEVSEDIDTGAIGFYVGHSNSRNNRWMIGYESRSFDFSLSDVTEDASGFRFDWQFIWGEGKEIQPYLAIGFGLYTLQEPIVLENTNLEGDDMSGFSFQMGLGAKYILNENVELDIAFERQAIAWQDIELSYWGGTETISTAYSHNSLAFGAAYKF